MSRGRFCFVPRLRGAPGGSEGEPPLAGELAHRRPRGRRGGGRPVLARTSARPATWVQEAPSDAPPGRALLQERSAVSFAQRAGFLREGRTHCQGSRLGCSVSGKGGCDRRRGPCPLDLWCVGLAVLTKKRSGGFEVLPDAEIKRSGVCVDRPWQILNLNVKKVV